MGDVICLSSQSSPAHLLSYHKGCALIKRENNPKIINNPSPDKKNDSVFNIMAFLMLYKEDDALDF